MENSGSRRNHVSHRTLMIETLKVDFRHELSPLIRDGNPLSNNGGRPPAALQQVTRLADSADGWLRVVGALAEAAATVSYRTADQMVAAVTSLVLGQCPLPSTGAVRRLFGCLRHQLPANDTRCNQLYTQHYIHSVCLVLACLAEKFTGPLSEALLTDDVLEFLMSNLDDNEADLNVTLMSIVALEKFAQTSANKLKIKNWNVARDDSDVHDVYHTLLTILKRVSFQTRTHRPTVAAAAAAGDDDADVDWVQRQIEFCAQWSLDNIFYTEAHEYSYMKIDPATRTDINAVLNDREVNEQLKLSPSGLEARCDSASFESVRCTYQVTSGRWYYEVTVVTGGVMQLGWAAANSKFLNHEGYGVGDDEYSVGYDGCRKIVWRNAKCTATNTTHCWKPGDVVGLLADVDCGSMEFHLNGDHVTRQQLSDHMKNATGLFAAASFTTHQHCVFNFGATPFRYPPSDQSFRTFNEAGTLPAGRKVLLPRHVVMTSMRQQQLQLRSEQLTGDGGANEDDLRCCTLCVDETASISLVPCQHTGYCVQCALKLDHCPICRQPIAERRQVVVAPPGESNNIDELNAAMEVERTEQADATDADKQCVGDTRTATLKGANQQQQQQKKKKKQRRPGVKNEHPSCQHRQQPPRLEHQQQQQQQQDPQEQTTKSKKQPQQQQQTKKKKTCKKKQ